MRSIHRGHPPRDPHSQGLTSLAPILLSSLSPPTSHKPPERLRHPPSPQNVVMTKHCMFFGVITLLVATVDALDEGPASLDLASARDELLHTRNRIKVLEDELTRRAAQEELQAGVARVFKLSSSWSAGEARAVQLSIEAQEPATEWLCSSASVAHVFQILLSTADGIPLSAALLAGCPRSGAPVRFSLSAATVHAWEQHALTSEEELGTREYNTNELAQAKLAAAAAAQSRDASILTRLRRAFSSMGGRRLGATTGDDDGRLRAQHAAHLPLSVCVRVEAFNSDADDMARTGDLRKYLAIRNPADLNPARGIALGCRRFTVLAARQQPVVGCFNVSSGGRAADPAAAPAHGGHGRPREFNAGANSVGDRTDRTDRTDPIWMATTRHHRPCCCRRARMAQSHRPSGARRGCASSAIPSRTARSGPARCKRRYAVHIHLTMLLAVLQNGSPSPARPSTPSSQRGSGGS